MKDTLRNRHRRRITRMWHNRRLHLTHKWHKMQQAQLLIGRILLPKQRLPKQRLMPMLLLPGLLMPMPLGVLAPMQLLPRLSLQRKQKKKGNRWQKQKTPMLNVPEMAQMSSWTPRLGQLQAPA